MPEIRAIDVCAGGGGWAVAARGTPIRIVAAFDHDEDCLATYCFNHPGVEGRILYEEEFGEIFGGDKHGLTRTDTDKHGEVTG
jgi:site-specific DNA-cytosine methylase